jgi:hypothetical protein
MSALILLHIFHSIMVQNSHHDTFKSTCSSADVTDFRRASGRAGLTMITKVHFAFLEELPSCLT